MIADSDSAGPRRGKCKIFLKKEKQENDSQNNKFDKLLNEKIKI